MMLLKPLPLLLLSVSSFPTLVAAHGYTSAGNDLKCPTNANTRLFRSPDNAPLTIAQCYEYCANTKDCNYFSIGARTSDEAFLGLCIGCKAGVTLDSHTGFDSYQMDTVRTVPMEAKECLAGSDIFDMNGCDYHAFLDGIDNYLTTEYWRCPEYGDTIDTQAIIDGVFDDLNVFTDSTTHAKHIVNTMCSTAWTKVPTSTFIDVDPQFNYTFMEEYIDGDTFLNHDTGSFQGTDEGNNIASFRNDEATNTVLDAIPSLASCAHNSIMCCFGRDRQPGDQNGNCNSNTCSNADPADNSNLCWTETNIPTFSDPFAFPGTSEGPIHCHGLAWDDDENSFTDQLKFNNLFFVSMFDHMYTRGYVETMVDSDNIPMCDCIENMPVVSRADCTQVDATQTFTVAYLGESNFVARKVGALDVQFNQCEGINPGDGTDKDNDLGSYVYRLNQEGKLSNAKMEGVFDSLVGYDDPNNNENEAACVAAYELAFGGNPGYPTDVANVKCPTAMTDSQGNQLRLFRIEDLTLEECQNQCYETEFCEYFSLGIHGTHTGVCIGCTDISVLETFNGLNSYQLTEKKTFP